MPHKRQTNSRVRISSWIFELGFFWGSKTHSNYWKLTVNRLTGVHSRLTEVNSRLTAVYSRLTGVYSRLTGVHSRLNWVYSTVSGGNLEVLLVFVISFHSDSEILTRKSNSKIQLEIQTPKSNSKIQLEILTRNPTQNPNSVNRQPRHIMVKEITIYI